MEKSEQAAEESYIDLIELYAKNCTTLLKCLCQFLHCLFLTSPAQRILYLENEILTIMKKCQYLWHFASVHRKAIIQCLKSTALSTSQNIK